MSQAMKDIALVRLVTDMLCGTAIEVRAELRNIELPGSVKDTRAMLDNKTLPAQRPSTSLL